MFNVKNINDDCVYTVFDVQCDKKERILYFLIFNRWQKRWEYVRAEEYIPERALILGRPNEPAGFV